MIDGDLDGEHLIFCERREIRRENKLGGGYIVDTRNHAYRSGIAGATCGIGAGSQRSILI